MKNSFLACPRAFGGLRVIFNLRYVKKSAGGFAASSLSDIQRDLN